MEEGVKFSSDILLSLLLPDEKLHTGILKKTQTHFDENIQEARIPQSYKLLLKRKIKDFGTFMQ